MAISVRKTIIEVDASQAIRAEQVLRAAQDARRESAQALAAVMETAEREQIEALKESTDAAKQAAGARREAALEAKQALAAATQAERDARREFSTRAAEERDAARARTQQIRETAQAQREAAALQRGFLDAVANAERELDRAEQARRRDARAQQMASAVESEHHAKVMAAYGADESAIMRRQEQALRERAAAERLVGNEVAARKADMQRELTTMQRIEENARERADEDLERRGKRFDAAVKASTRAANEQGLAGGGAPVQKTREWKDAVDDVKQSYVGIAAGIGNIVTGIQSAVALSREVVSFVDETADAAIQAKNVGANLQVSIAGARGAFKGYVDDIELARIANQAFELGVVRNGQELEELAAGVQAKAERLGVDSTQLFENAVTAIGRGSALILDNLGIILDQAKAEEIYAEKLGVTVKQLTALQREEAFQKAAMIEISKAGKDVSRTVDGMAESWKQGRVDWENFRTGVLGFSDTMGQARDLLRGMTQEELDRLGRKLDDMEWHGASINEVNEILGEYGLTLKDVEKAAADAGTTLDEMITKAGADLQADAAERARKEIEAANRERFTTLNAQADEIDQATKITGILDTHGKQERDILIMQEEALMLRLEAAEAIKDQNAQLEITRALEENRARQEVAGKKRRGGGRGNPNAALERELKLTLAIADAQRSILEAESDSLQDLEQREAVQLRLVELAREELDARQQAEEARKIRGKDAAVEQEIELLEIATERRLLDLEVEARAREQAKEAAQERIEALDREIAIQAELGASVELLERQRLQAHLLYLEQFGERSEREAFDHDLGMQRAAEIRAARTADEEAALDRYNAEVERLEARGSAERDYAVQRIELEMRIAQAAGDADRIRQLMHQRELARIKREVDRRKLAISASNQLLTQGMGVFSMVADAAIKDEAKREKAMMRARGIEAMARGAIETVEAVAAFASFNFVQGALHTAAAAVAFGTGAALLAGKVPQRGGDAVSAGAGAGGAEHQTVMSEGSSGGGNRESAPVPPSAEELIRLREGATGTVQTTASKQGGNVYQIGTIYSGDAGTLINDLEDQTARKWGRP